MRQLQLTDGSGQYFNVETAQHWAERREHDGRNLISLATGSQWEHETLYRTAGGRYIIEHSSQWQGSRDRVEAVDPATAAAWLSRCGYTAETAQAAGLGAEFAALEIQ